ncbi:DUF3048 domain-containing protein [Candidatus Peregrinibacteria bacterium]|nr:DUF3048 domain-containing protein [Candidatus Peregrinibacteria bacterium]
MSAYRFLRKGIFLFLAVTAAASAGYFAFLIFRGIDGAPGINLYKPLTPPIGVMIENELLARPFQKGLSLADKVYEAPTEGGITRFLAIFMPGNIPEKFGPVRSARSYFLDWMHEWKGVYVHVGGHSDVLRRLAKEDILNADQFVLEDYFRRENVGKTSLEHTMFSGREAMEKLAADKNWVWQKPAHLENLQKNSQRTQRSADFENYPAVSKVSIDFGFPTYRVDYEYDPAANSYNRFQAKKPHIDQANNNQISPRTVIVQRVKAWDNGDPQLTISIKTIADGEATVFQHGRVIQGKWKKESLESPTKFFDEKGREIFLDLTPVWIEILPFQNSFTFQAPVQ